MKNEWLVRAIGEIDDDLIAEARPPIPKAKRFFPVLARYTAIAACLALLLLSGFALTQKRGGFGVTVNGIELAPGMTAEVAFSPLAPARAASGPEIPLVIESGTAETVLLADGNGLLACKDGALSDSLTVSGRVEVVWILLPLKADPFTLRITGGGKTVILSAVIDVPGEKILLTEKAE